MPAAATFNAAVDAAGREAMSCMVLAVVAAIPFARRNAAVAWRVVARMIGEIARFLHGSITWTRAPDVA